LQDLGKGAEIVESESPLKLGLKGQFKGVRFELTGRAQLRHEILAAGHAGERVTPRMQIRMLEDRWLQDAGMERVLRAGRSYDVAERVGRLFVGSGSASVDEVAGSRPPEAKPAFAPETKRRRR